MTSTMPLTKKAIAAAIVAHDGQYRKFSKLPYVVHPVEVESIVKQFKESHNIDNICAAAMLHDTIEDAGYSYTQIFQEYGCMVAGLVMEVTTDKTACNVQGKTEYMNHKLATISSYGCIIKLADMLANITDNPNEKTIARVRANHDFVLRNRKLTGAHRALLGRIDTALKELHNA